MPGPSRSIRKMFSKGAFATELKGKSARVEQERDYLAFMSAFAGKLPPPSCKTVAYLWQPPLVPQRSASASQGEFADSRGGEYWERGRGRLESGNWTKVCLRSVCQNSKISILQSPGTWLTMAFLCWNQVMCEATS